MITHSTNSITPSITGFYVNPDRNNALPFMSRQNIAVIIRTGEEQISGFGEELKEDLKAYPDEIPKDGLRPLSQKGEE